MLKNDDDFGHEKWPLIAAIFAVFVWHVIFLAHLNLIPDECSYWAWFAPFGLVLL